MKVGDKVSVLDVHGVELGIVGTVASVIADGGSSFVVLYSTGITVTTSADRVVVVPPPKTAQELLCSLIAQNKKAPASEYIRIEGQTLWNVLQELKELNIP